MVHVIEHLDQRTSQSTNCVGRAKDRLDQSSLKDQRTSQYLPMSDEKRREKKSAIPSFIKASFKITKLQISTFFRNSFFYNDLDQSAFGP